MSKITEQSKMSTRLLSTFCFLKKTFTTPLHKKPIQPMQIVSFKMPPPQKASEGKNKQAIANCLGSLG